MSSSRNLGKHYIFTDVSYYEGAACDCCEGMDIEEYYCAAVDLLGQVKPSSESGIMEVLLVINKILTYEELGAIYLTEVDYWKTLQGKLLGSGITWGIGREC